MSRSDLSDRMIQIEQRQQRQDRVVDQIHEILLRIAQQQEANTIAIAELRALIELQTGNGHSG